MRKEIKGIKKIHSLCIAKIVGNRSIKKKSSSINVMCSVKSLCLYNNISCYE